MAQCVSCARTLSILENAQNLTTQTNRCNACNARFNAMIAQWRQEITNYFNAGRMSAQIEQEYYRRLTIERVPQDIGQLLVHMMQHFRSLNETSRYNNMIQRWSQEIDSYYKRGGLSAEIEEEYYQRLSIEQVPREIGQPFVSWIKHLRSLTDTARFTAMVEQWKQEIGKHYREDGISVEIAQEYYQRLSAENVPKDLAQSLKHIIERLRSFSEIRWGNLPRLQTSVYLDSDETAHFEWEAIYYKPTKTEKVICGRIVATNKKMRFLSDEGNQGMTIDWNNIGEIQTAKKSTYLNGKIEEDDVLRLVITKGAGGGLYWVDDYLEAKIAIDTLVRLWKRQLVIYKEQAVKGSIPDHIKAIVFQRDNGTCRQCGYQGEYIEYDHIYPRSMGGQNTAENIQLLCRKCNLRKGARI